MLSKLVVITDLPLVFVKSLRGSYLELSVHTVPYDTALNRAMSAHVFFLSPPLFLILFPGKHGWLRINQEIAEVNMSSENASLADSSSAQKEASSSIMNKGKGKGEHGFAKSSPPDTYSSPSSASSIWVLTFDASQWVDQFCGTVTLPIPPEYVYRKTIQTGAGFGILKPRGVQTMGVIGIYPSEAAAKNSGWSWVYEQLKDRRVRETAGGLKYPILPKPLPYEKEIFSIHLGRWKRSGWVPAADRSYSQYEITDIARNLGLSVMVTEAWLQKTGFEDEYVTETE